MQNTYILRGGTILSFDPQNPVLQDQAILIADGRILQIAPEAEFSLLQALCLRQLGPIPAA